MKIPKYICARCKMHFTRRWNANRHCNNKHYGTEGCVILFRDYILHKEIINLSFSDQYSENTTQIPYQQNLSFQERTNSNPMLYTNFNLTSNPNENYFDKDIRLSYTLNQLAPHYQQLENLLSHLPPSNRAFILGNILCMTLNDENPIAFINNQLEEFQKANTRHRMLDAISKSSGLDKNITKEVLKMGLKPIKKLLGKPSVI